jgi:hypothetical protein
MQMIIPCARYTLFVAFREPRFETIEPRPKLT